MWKESLDYILEVLFPRHCLGCEKPGAYICAACLGGAPLPEKICFACGAPSENGVCPECARGLPMARAKIFWATSYKYEPVRQLIRALKYRRAASAAALLADLIHTRLFVEHSVFNKTTADNMIIIPVPMHATRLRERGKNHAELIAEELARLARLPLAKNILIKTRPTHSQVEARARALRLKNLAGSFAVPDSDAIAGKNILLVDDVLTTGATIIEASRALRAAGAREVIAIIAAH